MPRTAPRLARMLACAAAPVMLVAGCSSDSGDKDPKDDASSSATASPSPTVIPAKFAKLPEVCETLPKKMVGDLVPEAKDKQGKTLPSANINESASCLWSGLDGFQYRQLTVSLKLFASDVGLGPGDKRAATYAGQQTEKAGTADGAKGAKTGTVTGVGDEAKAVATTTKKDGDEFKNETVVARTANVVVTVEYRGAGYEDAKPPKPEDLKKDAEKAAKEAVAAVGKANGATAPDDQGSGGQGGGTNDGQDGKKDERGGTDGEKADDKSGA
ncbi:hypothetical protein [Streptomyces sp. NPDC057702]|uniref:hypothetical protein n=1 Tax=unclassified Streptomyces TaxID=2593676 RepID=UPI0036C4AA32